ncbi:hypothetical protein PG990_013669 [Apiospora arundinis]
MEVEATRKEITDSYAGLFAVQKWLHLVLLALHEKYGIPLKGDHAYISITADLLGSVIRPAPNRLLFQLCQCFQGYICLRIKGGADTLLSPAIYQNDDRITKSLTYELMARNGVYSRRVVGHAFSPRSIRSFEPALQSQVDVYLEQILGSSGQPVNMTEKMGHLAADVVGQLALGYDLAM